MKVVKQQVAKYQKTSELTEEIAQYLNSLNIQLPGMQKQIAVVSSLLQRKEQDTCNVQPDRLVNRANENCNKLFGIVNGIMQEDYADNRKPSAL